MTSFASSAEMIFSSASFLRYRSRTDGILAILRYINGWQTEISYSATQQNRHKPE